MTSLQERMGYGADAKLLLLHCDDFGMCHAQNTGTVACVTAGFATSTSIMAPCPWRDEAIAYAAAHPDLDVGMHCTLTAEWETYRWGPVANPETVPSLVDPDGYLWHFEEPFEAHAKADDVERELRAQHAYITKGGANLTHIDFHMNAILTKPEHFDVYVNLAQEWNLPFMMPDPQKSGFRAILDPDYQRMSKETEDDLRDKGLFAIDYFVMDVSLGDERTEHYLRIFSQLEPGITYVAMHPATDTDELRTVALRDGKPEIAYRTGDLAFLCDDSAKATLDEYGVHLVNWREIGKALLG